MEFFADVIVLGLGAMGSATTYQLAKRGVKVLGLDQFSPPHTLGSTHGDTRLTRQAIGEGESYTPLALRSHELWREVEKESGQHLLTLTGGLIITDSQRPTTAHGNADFMGNTLRSAAKYGIAHQQLKAQDIRSRYPQFQLGGTEKGYFENNAGFLLPESCVRAQLDLATRHGASLHIEEKMLGFTQEASGVSVKTNRGEYKANKLILCAGPWVPHLLERRYRGPFKVYRQVLYWFDVSSSYSAFAPDNFPVFIWDFGTGEGGGMYGFPAIDGPHGGLKLAREEYQVTTDPEHVNRTVSQQEMDEMFERFVEPRLAGVDRKCLKAVSCLYTVTPDSGFILDIHPDHKDVIIASPCSGHGFKHSAAIGETLAQLATQGKTEIDISAFSLQRFH